MKPRIDTPHVSPTPSQVALQDSQPARSIVSVTNIDAQDRVRLVMGTRGCAPINAKPASTRDALDAADHLPAHSPQLRHRRRMRAMSLANGQPVRQQRDAQPIRGDWFNQLFIKVMTYLFGRHA